MNLIIVIPSYIEENISPVIEALQKCELPVKMTEVIVVINASENETEENKNINLKTYEYLCSFKNKLSEPIRIYPILLNHLPHKNAGVGLARKIGMDEAVRRFDYNKNDNGIIICLDADCTVDSNYLIELENHFQKYPKSPGCSIYFEHPTESNNYPINIYNAITDYELFLRYYNQSLRYCGLPYAYHTVGSSMVVRSWAYQKQGGMNQRKAGEDFYFLHKIISLGNFTELNDTCVFPSPRVSVRVPFGTGVSVGKIINENNSYKVYDFQIFIDLKCFVDKISLFYNKTPELCDLPETILHFLSENNFLDVLENINKNSASKESFIKRFFQWFDAFMVLKFVHFARDQFYSNTNIEVSSIKLLEAIGKPTKYDTKKKLLLLYRDLEKSCFIRSSKL